MKLYQPTASFEVPKRDRQVLFGRFLVTVTGRRNFPPVFDKITFAAVRAARGASFQFLALAAKRVPINTGNGLGKPSCGPLFVEKNIEIAW